MFFEFLLIQNIFLFDIAKSDTILDVCLNNVYHLRLCSLRSNMAASAFVATPLLMKKN